MDMFSDLYPDQWGPDMDNPNTDHETQAHIDELERLKYRYEIIARQNGWTDLDRKGARRKIDALEAAIVALRKE